MCTTCGCSADRVSVTDLDAPARLDPARAHRHHDDAGHHHHHHDAVLSSGLGSEAESNRRTLVLEQEVLGKNNLLAARNRSWLEGHQILAINLMSSPGAGKTTLLERTIRDLSGDLPLSVIEGDQETLLDADRIRSTGCRVVQINTGAGCHLDAEMLARGLDTLDPPAGSLVMIENVGNLVCPALFDLGEQAKVVIASVTEGEDKPLKYPHMFRAAELMLLNKVDLLPHLTFDVERCIACARQVNPGLEVIRVSATRGDGLADWYAWLRRRLPNR
jgi:hydrogenase nickel incorporation protein HypB